jgi:hypothetical protein
MGAPDKQIGQLRNGQLKPLRACTPLRLAYTWPKTMDEELSTMSALQTRLDTTLSRADEVLRERLKREIAAQQAEDAERADEAREKARADAEKRRMVAAKFDDAFRAFSVETPQARDDESPGQYRRRLFSRLQRKLPDSHDLVDIRADDLPSGQAYLNFEQMIIDAAKAEGEHPSFDNLPPSGELISRVRTDEDTGAKATHYFGWRSFIADLSRPGRRVLRIAIRRPATSC